MTRVDAQKKQTQPNLFETPSEHETEDRDDVSTRASTELYFLKILGFRIHTLFTEETAIN